KSQPRPVGRAGKLSGSRRGNPNGGEPSGKQHPSRRLRNGVYSQESRPPARPRRYDADLMVARREVELSVADVESCQTGNRVITAIGVSGRLRRDSDRDAEVEYLKLVASLEGVGHR